MATTLGDRTGLLLLVPDQFFQSRESTIRRRRTQVIASSAMTYRLSERNIFWSRSFSEISPWLGALLRGKNTLKVVLPGDGN